MTKTAELLDRWFNAQYGVKVTRSVKSTFVRTERIMCYDE